MEDIIKGILDEYARHNFYSDVVRLRIAREINTRIGSSNNNRPNRTNKLGLEGRPESIKTADSKTLNSTSKLDKKTSTNNLKKSPKTIKDSIRSNRKDKQDVDKSKVKHVKQPVDKSKTRTRKVSKKTDQVKKTNTVKKTNRSPRPVK